MTATSFGRNVLNACSLYSGVVSQENAITFIDSSNRNVRGFATAPWRKRSIAVKNRLRLASSRYKKPGQIQAISMPLSPQEMDNSTLVTLAQLGKKHEEAVLPFILHLHLLFSGEENL
jgi:hypothetical protein